MKKQALALLTIFSAAIIAGCGGGGGSSVPLAATTSSGATTTVSGAVADGYLVNATVFVDKNGNYQMDSGEPSTTTDANGAYTLNMDPADVGKYPIMAMAIKGQTLDKDTNQPVQNSYMLSMPASAVSGTAGNNFISPMSTLLREMMEANPSMTIADAMTQLRNQMNMPVGMNMMGDYMAGSTAGQFQAHYQTMHQVAQQVAGVMSSQSGLVMTNNGANMGRYRSMMSLMNQDLPQITANVGQGQGMNSTFMNSMTNQMQTQLSAMPMTGGNTNSSTPGSGGTMNGNTTSGSSGTGGMMNGNTNSGSPGNGGMMN